MGRKEEEEQGGVIVDRRVRENIVACREGLDTGRRREARGAAGCAFVSLYRPDTKLLPPAGRAARPGAWDQNSRPCLVWLRRDAPSPPSRQHTALLKTLHLPLSGGGCWKRQRRTIPRDAG